MLQQETDKRAKNIAILKHFLPEGTAETAYEWIQQYRFRFRISRSRNSRFGDYQSPQNGNIHKISVNHDLNRYAFLITFCHEVAHLVTWEKHRDRVNPHGTEWKREFADLLKNFVGKNIFPPDVEWALRRYMINPKASSCTDQDLFRILKKYDQNPATHLEEIPMGSLFSMSGKIYRKGKKQRTRYLCQSVEDRQLYYISGVAEVKVVSESFSFD